MTNKKTDIWNKIHIDSPDKCWKWKGKPHHTGYAFFYYENKEYMAHRITYELTYGPIPEGLHVCHKCDNPACCNPSHLFLGTHQDNMDDMVKKGRNKNPKGEEHPRATLSEIDIIKIRILWASGDFTLRQLAERYNTTRSNIKNIIYRRNWKHI